MADLRSSLEQIARRTWTDLRDSRLLGTSIGEVGITDRNLLDLLRIHPDLVIRKHAPGEEVETGADFEWWFGSSQGWTCLAFQAKKLHEDGLYRGITQRVPSGQSQVDVLIQSCLRRSARLHGATWPLFCFYNYWRGGWPPGVPVHGADPDGDTLISSTALPIYGCAVASAQSVRKVLYGEEYSRRRTARSTHLANSRPWAEIFSDTANSSSLASAVTAQVRDFVAPSLRKALAPGRRATTDLVARSYAVWRDPSLIPEPPPYVLDMLEGKTASRKLKPLAPRSIVLYLE